MLDFALEGNTKEILRYLGYGKQDADEAVMKLIVSCLGELKGVIRPKYLAREFPLVLDESGIDGGCFRTESRNLRRNLEDCEGIVVFAATLGTGADYLLGRYSRVRMSRAVVLQAAAAALLEEYCNGVCGELAGKYKEKGLFLRPRFSPGYGDFPLDVQPELLDALEAGKRLGIKLTDSFLMMPSKSVTAVMGISSKPLGCRLEGCEACGKKDCLYRRET